MITSLDSDTKTLAMPDYAREIIHKGKDHFKLTDGLPDKAVCPTPGTDEHTNLQLELHKLFLSRDVDYGTLWRRYSAWLEEQYEEGMQQLPLRQKLNYWPSWASDCMSNNNHVHELQLHGRTLEYAAAICESLQLISIYPYHRMDCKSTRIDCMLKDTHATCNSIVMARIMAAPDHEQLAEHQSSNSTTCLHYYKPLIDPTANINNPYDLVWVGQVRCFYQVLTPGHQVLDAEEQVFCEFADVEWFKWPEAAAQKHCAVLGVPIVMRSKYTDAHWDALEEDGRFAWCSDIMPTNITLAPCKHSVGGSVQIDPSRWHVLHRHANFFMHK